MSKATKEQMKEEAIARMELLHNTCWKELCKRIAETVAITEGEVIE